MGKVLIVDDDRDICSLVAFKLQQSGHEVLVEHDGEAGLATVLSTPLDVVVLDWMMPRLSGIEVCVALRREPNLERLPVLMLTARAQEGDIQRGFAAGADDYLVKPFSPRELATRIESLLERSRT